MFWRFVLVGRGKHDGVKIAPVGFIIGGCVVLEISVAGSLVFSALFHFGWLTTLMVAIAVTQLIALSIWIFVSSMTDARDQGWSRAGQGTQA